jgi:hypothetical protein
MSRLRNFFVFAVTPILLLSGCGTFSLGTAIPQTPKTANEQQLDTLECKDKARLAASTAERQVGAFLLGMTIIGVPAAFELEKSKQREVYKECMEGKRYKVASPDDAKPSDSLTVAPSTTAKIDVPAGWEKRDLTAVLTAGGGTLYMTNKTTESGFVMFTTKLEAITDADTYIKTRIASQMSSLENSTARDIVQTSIGGLPVTQVEVTGNLRTGQKLSLTYLLTFYEGSNEVILISMWSSAANFPNQRGEFQKILNTISGISPSVKSIASPSPIKIKLQDGSGGKPSNSMGRLNELNELLKKGLITQQDYNIKKAEILKSM